MMTQRSTEELGLFLDLCGGPGAWSQYLLQKGLQGFGFTLRSGDWYPELMSHPGWRPLWGADGTGDLLKPQNLLHASQQICSAGGVAICVADGGFSDKAIPPNLLELYFYRLFLAEVLTAANCLIPGGSFVCKFYSSFSSQTSSLLFLLSRLFTELKVVKPQTSRVAGPERYLFATGFRANEETEVIKQALWSCHAHGAGRSPLQLPLLAPLVPDLRQDARFMLQLQEMVVTLSNRQAMALRAIRQRAETLEDMALDVAEEAQKGAEFWAAAARKQRDERERDRSEESRTRDVERELRRERSERFNFKHGRPQVKRHGGRLGLASVEFNRWR
eukprot:Skav230304  [mRNA]  locus=scaffold430:42471:48798:+ [translate_table: standard]